MSLVLQFELILKIGSIICAYGGRQGARAPVGAALDRAGLDSVGPSTSHNPMGLHGLVQG
jgi:hypothetical protein